MLQKEVCSGRRGTLGLVSEICLDIVQKKLFTLSLVKVQSSGVLVADVLDK